MWWRGRNGLEVRLASADTAPSVERERLSLLAMMVALVVARRPDA
jgi:hypothetical protein